MKLQEQILKQLSADEEFIMDGLDFSEYIPLKDHKYTIVSKVGYLLGVSEKYFADNGKILRQDIYDQLNLNKHARIIRNLCMLRTAIIQKFGYIIKEIQNGRDVLSLEDLPQEAIKTLINDNIRLPQKPGTQPVQYIIEINKLISDRVNNCKSIFSTWLKWEYIKELFIMPNGFTKKGTALSAEQYYKNKNAYPFRVWLNIPMIESGNILYNDRRFVQLLYEWHEDMFTDISKVMDVSEYVKSNIYDFIDESERLVLIVDCENSDIYNLISMLKGLAWEGGLDKISKIILINDVHTSIGWQRLNAYTNIPIEHIMTERVKKEKSIVDGTVISKTYEEFFMNKVDSFILFSSDSDYWSLINMLKSARFLVAVEHEKCSGNLKSLLEENGIFYCYIDDFYSGEKSDEIKRDMLLKVVTNNLPAHDFNIINIFEKAIVDLRANLSDCEKEQFISKYLKNLTFNCS